MPPNNKKTIFNSQWLNMEEFKSWLREDVNDQFLFHCDMCRKSYSLSNMGITALLSHMKAKKHKDRMKAVQLNYEINSFLEPSINKKLQTNQSIVTSTVSSACINKDIQSAISTTSDCANTSIEVCLNQPKLIQKPMSFTLLLEHEKVTRSEIIWALHVISTHMSMSSGGKSVDIMKIMFPDSNIASSLQLQRTKLSYVITHGLARYFKQEFEETLSKCEFYTVAFDESLNKVSQKEQMDIHVRYWNSIDNEVSSSYYSSVILGHTTAVDLISAIKTSLNSLNLKKVLQLSMDGPNVNIKVLRDLKEELRDNNDVTDPVIFDLGTCGIHTMHNAFKTGIKASKWNIIEFLRSIYNLFKDVPARRADYTYYSASGSSKFPKKFCAVRWLQNIEVSQRALDILPDLETYVTNIKNTPRKPSSYSFELVEKLLNDKFLKAKLAFFQMVASEIEPFLKAYQSDAPLGPFLYTDLNNILKLLLSRFIKPEIMVGDISKLNIMDKDNSIGAKKINLGYMTRQALRLITATDKEILLFRADCLVILQTICSKIMLKSPLKYKLVKGISFCDPQIITASINMANNGLKITLSIFVENNWLTGYLADRIESEITVLFSNSSFIERAKAYVKGEIRLDHFWSNIGVTYDLSSELLRFLKMIFILSHGNASVERGFSVNKDCLIENLHEESLIAQRHVWAAIQKYGGVEKVNITKKMIMDVRNSRSYYKEALENKKQKQKEAKEANEKRKKAGVLLKELNQKKIRLLEDTQSQLNMLEEEIQSLRK